MPEDHIPQSADAATFSTENFGGVRQDSESFGNVRHAAENFRNMPQSSESFGSERKAAKRTEGHTLTVREVARVFEQASVARSERSIINWCQPNRMGVARLDAYFDPNERKYFITPQSVDRAVEEEKAKIVQRMDPAEHFGNMPNAAEDDTKTKAFLAEDDSGLIKKLEQELLDLKITNRGKDYFIEQLQKEQKAFAAERKEYVENLISSHRRLGELETQLRQLSAPERGEQN
jgi:hypothetical protein